jgi:hypothetical protein
MLQEVPDRYVSAMSTPEILSLPTYRDSANHYYNLLKHELKLRPRLLEQLKKLQNERELEARVLNRACDKWAQHIVRNIFGRWATECAMNDKRAMYVPSCPLSPLPPPSPLLTLLSLSGLGSSCS